MQPTTAQVIRVTKEYSDICKEPVTVEFVTTNLYVFGTELACLRLHYKMPGKVGYSNNTGQWYYKKSF